MGAESESVVDAWIQHPTPSFLGQPMFATLRRWMRLETIPESIPLDFTLAALDSANVKTALISAWWGPAGPLISNDEVAAWTMRHTDRLRGVAAVPADEPMRAVRELRRAVKKLGFVGVRLLPWLWRLPPNDRRFYPIYAECIELGIPACIQVGHTGPLMPSEFGRPIPYVDEVALDFPELKLVCGHIGYPWENEMIALATKYENVFIDTSAYKISRYPEALATFLRGRGRSKVLFGSNHPMISPAECLAGLDTLALDPESRAAFLRENARRVFSLEG